MENFTLRKIAPEDAYEVYSLGALAWINPVDIDKRVAEEKFTPHGGALGLFTENGELAASITEEPFTVNFDGNLVPMNGIAGVSTKPEYRYGGSIRRIFSYILRQSFSRGDVFSALFPFSHKFYRKFGYEVCCPSNKYAIELDMLAPMRLSMPLRRIECGEEAPLLTEIHNSFAKKYNMCVHRTEDRSRNVNRGHTYRDLVNHFVIGDGAYITFKHFESEGRIEVRDWAFTSEKYIPEMLALLGRFSPMMKTAEIYCPMELPLEAYVESTYKITRTVDYGIMSRIVNAQKALELCSIPEGADFTVSVSDDGIPQNNGVWRVRPGSCVRTDAPADLECDIRTLALIVLGTWDLASVSGRPDVRINSNEETLKKTFRRKPVFLNDTF